MSIEEEFDINIPENEIENIRTIGEFKKYLFRVLDIEVDEVAEK
jgi:acyl carrier protein